MVVSLGVLVKLEQGPQAAALSSWSPQEPHGDLAVPQHGQTGLPDRALRAHPAHVSQPREKQGSLSKQRRDTQNMEVL